MARQTYYGLRAHVRICWPGVIVAATLAPANLHDTEAADELLDGVQGWASGDRNYWKPDWQEILKEQGLHLPAPFKKATYQWWVSQCTKPVCLDRSPITPR